MKTFLAALLFPLLFRSFTLLLFLYSLFSPVRSVSPPELMLSGIYTDLTPHSFLCLSSLLFVHPHVPPFIKYHSISAHTHYADTQTHIHTHTQKYYYYNVRHLPSFHCYTVMALEYTVCTLSDNICLRGCCLTLSADLTGDNIHKTSSQWLIVLYRSCMWVNPWPHVKHPHTYTYFHYSIFFSYIYWHS